MSRIKQLLRIMLLMILLSFSLHAVDFGFIAGKNSKPSASTWGISAGSGFFVPLVKLEFELLNQKDLGLKDVSVGLKVRKKIGKFAPYAVIGAGAKFETFSITFKDYDYFTFIGGGTHFYIMDLFSLRFDLRYQSYSEINNVRLSAGVFVHI